MLPLGPLNAQEGLREGFFYYFDKIPDISRPHPFREVDSMISAAELGLGGSNVVRSLFVLEGSGCRS